MYSENFVSSEQRQRTVLLVERMGRWWRAEVVLRSPQTRKDVPLSGHRGAPF